MYRVEMLNDHHDWVLRSSHKTWKAAETAAEKVSESGYTARIISNGRILRYIEREAK